MQTKQTSIHVMQWRHWTEPLRHVGGILNANKEWDKTRKSETSYAKL